MIYELISATMEEDDEEDAVVDRFDFCSGNNPALARLFAHNLPWALAPLCEN